MTRITDFRADALEATGPDFARHVELVAARLHRWESSGMHALSERETQHGACMYCWRRAARAICMLDEVGLLRDA